MRICLLAANGFFHDPRATSLAHSLRSVGHDVAVIATSPGAVSAPGRGGVDFVASRRPSAGGPVGKALRRAQPARLRSALHTRALGDAGAATGATLFYPTAPEALPAAIRAASSGGAVARAPQWPAAGPRDLIMLAPSHPELSRSPAGEGLPLHTPAAGDQPRGTSRDGRHGGTSILLAYRKTDINPGKYLEHGLRRAGVDVRLETEGFDWATVDRNTRAVVFVEGPYPALEVKGENPGIPVVFWIHHGEHHLAANLRLVDRYGAHAVLLAHSWHLAHRFPVPVHRFPFGMATELLDPSMPYHERPYDVAMVGAYVRGGGPYSRRGRLVEAVEATLPTERVAFASGVDSETMAKLYGSARVILNEGGTRHFPITMRVLEAIGSGALLLSDFVPGTEMLLEAGTHYVVLEDDVAGQLRDLFARPAEMAKIAAAGLDHATVRHSYDHRIDDLMAVIDTIDPSGDRRPLGEPAGALARLIDRDVEVQRIVQVGAQDLSGDLPDREVWDAAQLPGPPPAGSYDAAVVRLAPGESVPELATAGRRYVYIEGDPAKARSFVGRTWPDADVVSAGDLTKIDLWAPAYRLPRDA